MGNEDGTQESLPLSPSDKIGTVTPKATPKARTAFSEGQMNALIHRFNIQKYLTPAEMKTLAGETGLTYKQVRLQIYPMGDGREALNMKTEPVLMNVSARDEYFLT